MSDTRARLLEENETALVELALQIAEKILQATLAAEPERVADVLRGALRKAYVRDRLHGRLQPGRPGADRAGAEDALQAQVGTLKGLELIGDRRVAARRRGRAHAGAATSTRRIELPARAAPRGHARRGRA